MSRSEIGVEPLGGVSPDPAGEFPFNIYDYLFHLLVTVGRQRDQELEGRLLGVGLNVGLYRALGVIERFGPCSMNELAAYSVVDRTTLTRTLDRLVKAGFVQRAPARADRRVVLVSITTVGLKAHREAVARVVQHNREALADIPEPLLRQFVRAEQRIVVNLSPDSRVAEAHLTLRRPE